MFKVNKNSRKFKHKPILILILSTIFFRKCDEIIATPKKCRIPKLIVISGIKTLVAKVKIIPNPKQINPLLRLFLEKLLEIPDIRINEPPIKNINARR
ncbi:MAG: hypothetical protein RR322_03580 [Oscillospiraceae bacterium]